jgi:TPR repeat protein
VKHARKFGCNRDESFRIEKSSSSSARFRFSYSLQNIFRQAADSDNPVGANNFGSCLEKGEGIDKDIDRAVRDLSKGSISIPSCWT